MTAESTPRKKNIGFTYGLIGGLILVVYLLLLYLGGVSYFLGALGWLGAVFIIGLAVMAGIKQKQINGGYLNFSEALKVVFTVFVVAFLIQTVFNFILLNYIDTSFRDALTLATLEKTEAFMKRMGLSESQIEEAMKNASNTNNYSVRNVSLGFGFMCIICFLVSLIIAAIIKKKRPPFENTFNQ